MAKHFLSKTIVLILVLLMLVSSLPVVRVCANKINNGFEYEVNNGEVTITDYFGVATEIIIPDTIENYIVTTIGEDAFEYCDKLTRITIPDSVTYLASDAFKGCSSLTSIMIPDSVTTIMPCAFEDCVNLKSITISNNITSIGFDAFYNTAYYNDASNWKEGVLYIGNALIKADDTVLDESYEVREGTTVIAGYAFSECKELNSISIPSSVKSMDYGAFEHCSRLTNVYITDIASWCNMVTAYNGSPLCNGNYLYLNNQLVTDIVIPDGVTKIPMYAFSCINLESVTIPDSVTSIEQNAFDSCNISSIYIPDSVTSIANYAFDGCTKLSTIKIPSSLTNIGWDAFRNTAFYNTYSNWEDGLVLYLNNVLINAKQDLSGEYSVREGTLAIAGGAFRDCKKLLSINFADSVLRIGECAFNECDNLVNVDISKNLELIEYSAFESCDGLTSIIIPNSVKIIEGYAFADCINLSEVVISENIDTIESFTFRNCISLTKVIIPSGVNSIGYCAFIGCTNLVLIDFPKSIISIGGSAFNGCSSIVSVDLSKSVISIADGAFSGCTSLASISLSKNIVNIDSAAFYNCISISDVYYSGTKEQWDEIKISTLNSCLTSANIHYNNSQNVEENSKSIAVFTTEKSFSVKTGKSMWLAFGLIDENGLIEDEEWSKMALVVSDDSIVSFSDYEKTKYGYSLEITGKKEGATNLTVTDTETGISTIIRISVYDMYSKTYSYPIEDMRVFYPNNKYEDHIATNIYNLNGIYVNNYKCEKNGSTYYVTFDAYNEKYHTGAVDVYDKNNRWIKSYEIEKFSDISGIWDTGEQFYYLASNVFKLLPGGEKSNLLTYEQESNSKHSHLSIEVPEDGYFTISNNIKESPGAYFYNTSELFFDAVVDFIDLGANGVESGDFAKIIMDEIQKDPTKQELLIELFKKTMEDELSEFAKNVMEGDIDEACSNLVVDYEDLLGALKIEWKHLFRSATGIGETAFEKVTGVYGMALSSMFKFNKGSSKMFQVLQFAESIDEPYVTVYANLDGDIVYNEGLIVDTNGNTDLEAVLQVFRVSNSDVIRVVLNSDNPLEQHEIYNICFVKDDKQVQPNGKVTVRIPIPQGMESDTCRVYRQENDGSWSALDAHVEGKYLVFETDHFSLYTIVGDMKRISVHTVPEKTTYDSGETLDTKGLIVEVDGELITNGFICSPSVLIGSGTQMITVRYGSAVTEFNVYVEGENTGNTTTTNPTEPETAYLLGDVNDDGKVNIKDATMIQKAAAKIIELTDDEKLRADVNVDNKNNVKDATAIQKFVAKIETGFPIGEPID